MQDNPALYGAIMFHGAAVLPRLRAMPYDQLQRLGLAASELSQTRPLWMPLGASETKGLVLDEWEPGKQLTGPFVMALMIFSLWIQCGEDPEMCSGLYEVWPIAEAVALCPKPQAPQS